MGVVSTASSSALSALRTSPAATAHDVVQRIAVDVHVLRPRSRAPRP